MRHPRPLRRLAALCALVGGLRLAGVTAQADSITVRTVPVPLNPQDPAQRTVGRLRYLGGLHLTADDKRFGGWSSLRLLPDGQRMTAISDEGAWLNARLVHDKAGFLTGLDAAEIGSLLGLDGKALEGKDNRDSESSAFLPDGSLVVGFEREHRIWRYPAKDGKPDGIPVPVKSPPGLAGAPFNGGIESLVASPRGRLFALTEYWIQNDLITGWIGGPDDWQPIGYRFERALRPSDACLLPSGDIAVLERAYNPDRGIVGVRLRQISKEALKPGAALGGRLIADILPPLTMDNFEGIDARKGPHGQTVLYVISDDNFNAQQRTLLLMFALNEP
jgi:hypothetical protein